MIGTTTRTCVPCDVRQATVERLQQSLSEALRRLREHADELELQRDHNRTLFALLLRRDRQLAVVRAELKALRDGLADAAEASGSLKAEGVR